MEKQHALPWVIVTVNGQAYGVSTEFFREIVSVREFARVPGCPPYLRGVINLRGIIVPLVDLRMRMGLPSALGATEAFCQMMTEREHDHVNWLAELEASVREEREFHLTTDPHQCAFGRWYDSYRTDNPWVAAQLKKFDRPHRAIHGVAERVTALVAKSDAAGAGRLLDETRNSDLAAMKRLFSGLMELVRETQAEPLMILELGRWKIAATIDRADAVEPLSVEDAPVGTEVESGGLVRQVGRREKTGQVVLILDPLRLMAA